MAEAVQDTPASEGSLLKRLLADGTPHAPDEQEAEKMDKLGDLVTRGAYAEAAQSAEALLRGGVRDVRLIGPFLFGAFLERGPGGMQALFSSIKDLLTEQWATFEPQGKKELLADNGLRWLFKNLSKHLENHERVQDEVWKGWCTPRNREPLRDALELSLPLLALLSTVLPKGASVASFRHLTSWLQNFMRALPAEPAEAARAPEASPQAEEAPAEQSEEETPVEADSHGEEVEQEQEAAPPEAPTAPTPRTRPQASGPMLPISPALELLIRKLQAFETLTRREDFPKASVIATDVLATLERFDPRVYLPSLFTPFFSSLSAHAHALEPLLHETDTLAFRALQQLYQVDLDTFLAQAAPRQDREFEE